jgi:hypothetical protein
MATYPAVAATSEAVLGLLEAAAGGSEFDSVEFEHYDAADLAKPATDTVSLLLHGVTLNPNRRPVQPRIEPDGRAFRPAVPLDLHFMVTAWAEHPVRQQRLLGWCIRVLADTPTLPAGMLNHFGPEDDVFRPTETVELIWEPLSAQDLAEIWEGAKSNRQPSASYLARIVEIESRFTIDEHPLVQTRDFSYAEANGR